MGWVVNATPRPFYHRNETPHPLYRGMDGLQGPSGRVLKISPPPAFNSRTVQAVASRYTDYAIPAHSFSSGKS